MNKLAVETVGVLGGGLLELLVPVDEAADELEEPDELELLEALGEGATG